MNRAGIAFMPWLVACAVVTPAPNEPTSPEGSGEGTAEAAPSPHEQTAAPQSTAPTHTVAVSQSTGGTPLPPVAVEASFELTRPAASTRRTDAELTEMETRSVSFGAEMVTTPCSVGGRNAQCVELADGPWLVSDYESLSGCPASLYLAGATKADASPSGKLDLAWTVRVTAQGVHGARIAVAANAKLFAVIESRRHIPTVHTRCSITWSGYRSPKELSTQPALMESPYR